MARQPIDYPAVIADLESKRKLMNERFDAAIAAIKQVLSLDSAEHSPLLDFGDVARNERPYKGLTMMDAAMKHLDLAGRSVPNLELAKALEDGGYAHKSKNFPNTLNSVLWRRSKTAHDVVKTDEGWSLYPRPGVRVIRPKDLSAGGVE